MEAIEKWLVSCLIFFLTFTIAIAQENHFPDATIVNDEGGPTVITGQVTYTNPFFTMGVIEPLVILEDEAGFIDRNRSFILSRNSQTIGQVTSDFYVSPFTYNLALPQEPQGSLRDVDHDSIENIGVMVFAIAYWDNVWGDPFLETRDLGGGGWSTAYASTRVSLDVDTFEEIIGGVLLVYAPDSQQGFPADFGEDGLLFTEDDPIVRLPQGYTLVNLDTQPFEFDRSRHPVVDLIEPEATALVDFSALTFTGAFDAMVQMFRTEYAFTEQKGINWDVLAEAYRPRFVAAEQDNDEFAYVDALREFLWEIPDGHIALIPMTPFIEQIRYDVTGGIGIAIRETDDGRVLVTYLGEDSPAARVGMQLGTEILAIDNTPIADVISSTEPWSQPFSTAPALRLEQLRYAVRFNADTTAVVVTYRNPGDDTSTTVVLRPTDELESLNSTTLGGDANFDLPVEYELLPAGYLYVAIHSFSDNALLTVQLWERMIQCANAAGISGIIIDMRQNGGGDGFLADQMAAYFFDEQVLVGYQGQYNNGLGDFYFDPHSARYMYPPQENLRYHGRAVVLVGPLCASACERFAYDLTLQNRAEIVGQYPTAGLGGSVEDFLMPLGYSVRFTTGRAVDANYNIHIEGIGVMPTVRVPVNEETLFSDGDPVLEYAIAVFNDNN